MFSTYDIVEVNGREYADVLRFMNAQAPDRFPPLQQHHIERGYWWLATTQNGSIIGFAGMVEMTPFDAIYLKRAYVSPSHRGHGLQVRFMQVREEKARAIGCFHLVSECADNPHSETNFIKAGFARCEPEQRWGDSNSIYFTKRLPAI